MAESTRTGWTLGRVAGLDVVFTPLAVVGTLLLWAIFFGIGRFVLHHGFASALVGGLLLAVMHWTSEVVHNLGHNAAARSTGYPMTATRLGFLLVLGVSVYPRDEPELPPAVHIRRALGGPIGSAIFTVVLGIATIVLAGTSIGWIMLVWFLDNLLVFTVGAWVPLGFNDVSTMLQWRRTAASSSSSID